MQISYVNNLLYFICKTQSVSLCKNISKKQNNIKICPLKVDQNNIKICPLKVDQNKFSLIQEKVVIQAVCLKTQEVSRKASFIPEGRAMST